MRVVIELKRRRNPEVILNNLFKQTQAQDTFGIKWWRSATDSRAS